MHVKLGEDLPNTRWILVFLRAQRVRVNRRSQYRRGSKASCAHRCQGGDTAACSSSWRTPCHQKSTRAATAGNCFLTFVMAAGRSGNCAAWAKASMASTCACNGVSTWLEVWGAESSIAKARSVRERVSSCCRYSCRLASHASPPDGAPPPDAWPPGTPRPACLPPGAAESVLGFL